MQRPTAVYVWDPFVRLFHWSLVSCVLLNQFVLEEGETAHEWTGYTAAALVGLRLLWGLVGPRHARFADWWPTPARVRRHVQALLRGAPDDHPGHNPLGAIMMLLLMALVLALALTGWLQTTDALWGEDWVEALHEGLANALLLAAAVHAAAALVMGRLQRVHLVRAMITGVKRYD
ncbi:putative Ni/Fe-hydrogenase B-type cytochrome subunit [Tepidimonas thermarum]|uniref:Putative Ni/Fe-hydrogenase B-type cytochrome subunit n=1 Tax=Tepidimonas thermarum TaxID=335431 RepID=A0A554WYL9_9BURK|nr:cytochrome b/b6 domain-containing protein [Tepidimonas thermarum]TSE28673.1 putative Ni/Fe-hydrogenase B-type cytochrome subunit [Tepidimonas thermarum]